MKKSWIFPLMMMVFMMLACSVTATRNTPEPAAPVIPTEIPTVALELPTEVPTEVPPPPPTEVPTMEPLPTEVPPTEIPPTEAPAEPQWESWVAAGDPSKQFAEFIGDRLTFSLPSAETYAYADRVDSVYGDVSVAAEFETFKGGANGIAVICRASNRGWYELRVTTVSSSDRPFAGSYELYRYDYSLKEQNKNPYVNLLGNLPRVFSVDVVNGYSFNTIGLLCEGNQIRPFINGVEQFPNKQEVFDNVLSEGTVGVGAMSFGGGDVEIVFHSVGAEPK